MSFKAALARRTVGAQILIISGSVACVGALPLLLYVLLGPADGNPIGLGLLFIVTAPLGFLGACVGVVTLLVQRLIRGRT